MKLQETNFEVVTSFKTDFNDISIKKFVSSKTGLSCILIDVEGPIVNGFFALGTEALDDDGCPHTLEHLIFLGSEDYPYKGVLDLLANRSLAVGTNAWTDVDHTCYTIDTAGEEGFLNLFNVYLDHILFPVLSYEGYYTEVHHINGVGEDSGVVYSEMQGRENGMQDRLQLAFQRSLYPQSGYQSETGGLMKNLRSLKVEKIRKFHKDFYHPQNLCCIVVGKVSDETDLLEKLQKFDEKILTKTWDSFKKPFQTTLNDLESKIINVEFPDEEELVGAVKIGFRGPVWEEFLEREALAVLATYLTDSSISLLQREFVECDDPLAADVSLDFLNYSHTGIDLQFEGVPTEKLGLIKDKLFQVMKNEDIDIDRIKLVIDRKKKQLLDLAESHPDSFFVRACIEDCLYGSSGSLVECFQHLKYLDHLLENDAAYWKSLIDKYILTDKYVCVVGIPSSKLAKQLQKEEKERIEEQRKTIGEEGLKKFEAQLEAAKAHNEKEIPDHILDSFPVPSVEKVSKIKVESLKYSERHNSSSKIIKEALERDKVKGLPVDIQFDNIKSSFVELNVLINTLGLSDESRVYLELFLDSFFELPMKNENGVEISWEDVVKGLETDLISYHNSIGFNSKGNFHVGSFPQFLTLHLKSDYERYPIVVEWLQKLVVGCFPTRERLLSSVNKLLNSIPDMKREGMTMCSSILKSRLFDGEKSNQTACFVLKQQDILKSASKSLKSPKTASAVVQKLDELRKILFTKENFFLHVAGAVNKLSHVLSPFETFKYPTSENFPKLNVKFSQKFLSKNLESSLLSKFLIIPMPSIESSFLTSCTKGPDSFEHPDLASCIVLTEYLTTMEGLFWKEVRGSGLAYGANLRVSPEDGLIYFTIYRSPDGLKAFKVVKQLLIKKIVFEKKMLDAAKSSVIYSTIAKEKNPFDAASQSFVNQILKGCGQDYNRNFLEKISKVDVNHLEKCLEKYLVPLFNPKTSVGAISTVPAKVKEYEDGFKSLGFMVEVTKTL